eukprot:scaffold1336_cov174-Amphora_coffeaeformis.AAC.10
MGYRCHAVDTIACHTSRIRVEECGTSTTTSLVSGGCPELGVLARLRYVESVLDFYGANGSGVNQNHGGRSKSNSNKTSSSFSKDGCFYDKCNDIILWYDRMTHPISTAEAGMCRAKP